MKIQFSLLGADGKEEIVEVEHDKLVKFIIKGKNQVKRYQRHYQEGRIKFFCACKEDGVYYGVMFREEYNTFHD